MEALWVNVWFAAIAGAFEFPPTWSSGLQFDLVDETLEHFRGGGDSLAIAGRVSREIHEVGKANLVCLMPVFVEIYASETP